MQNFETIIDRAFLCMILADRGLLELPQHGGRIYSVGDREKKRLQFLAIVEQRGLASVASKTERQVLATHVEKLTQEEFGNAVWQYEAIPVLLWSVGLREFPVYDGRVCDQDFHSLLGKHRTTESKLERPPEQPNVRQIQRKLEVAMLWHWRCRNRPGNKELQNEDIATTIKKIFGPNYGQFITDIPISKTVPRDFLVDTRPFYQLSSEVSETMLLQSKWRHHALEWVLNDGSWDGVDTST